MRVNQLLDEEEYLTLRQKAKEENDGAFLADIGAPAVRELLRRLDVDKTAEELRTSVAVEGVAAPQEADAQAAQDRRRVPQLGRCRRRPEQAGVDDPGRRPGDSA